MKFWAAILLVNITFFLVQPVFASYNKPACVKTCCPKSSKNKNECSKTCNPLFACMYCQYLPAKAAKLKTVDFNAAVKYFTGLTSSTLQGFVANWWHPPNNCM